MKRVINDDLDSSDDSVSEGDNDEGLNGDERAEQQLFRNPFGHRKRRRLDEDSSNDEQERPRRKRAK